MIPFTRAWRVRRTTRMLVKAARILDAAMMHMGRQRRRDTFRRLAASSHTTEALLVGLLEEAKKG